MVRLPPRKPVGVNIRARDDRAAAPRPQHAPKRACAKPASLPKLVPELDEYHRFADALAAELETLDDNGALDHEDEDEEALEESAKLRQPDTTAALIDTMIQIVGQVCGPVPDRELFPDNVHHNIAKHDHDYMTILNGLFEVARSTSESEVDDSPFTLRVLRWLQTNSGEKTRNALSELLISKLLFSTFSRLAHSTALVMVSQTSSAFIFCMGLENKGLIEEI
ncbi:hypothetical protein E0Z10_g7671 [Xylaria hypoxylon]|uniref:Uncharacterized protein n=1 Tax=Xylaria hypoxylon TaxID=37992 RepID=A0A4Z0YXI0_9PEZI|nr:hypothetical protein E0Z10_g7671 [Xylaria hypoxylon]